MVTPSKPRVGVVIRTKDRELFVTRALRTVLDQTYSDWKVTLVNDGGDAETLTAAIEAAGLAEHFSSGKMNRLDMQKSVGRSDAFNHGAKSLSTQFVCCLDDDDCWAPEFLETLVALYDKTAVSVPDLRGVAAQVTAVREEIVEQDGVEQIVPLGTDELPLSFRRTDFFLNPIAYATYRHDLYPVQWMLDRESVLDVGGFPSDFNVMEDRAFMVRFLENWRLAICDKPLAFHHRRVHRHTDADQSAAMNTLDNPSYDWRFYADLSKIEVNSPPDNSTPSGARTDAMIRAAAGTVIKELNDETSALWHKINGEAAHLRSRIDALETRMGAAPTVSQIETEQNERCWSLWDHITPHDIGYELDVGTPFLDRFSLSMANKQPGQLLHGSPGNKQLIIQIPNTEDFAAVEISLDGLFNPHGTLRCELILASQGGYLFQTALSVWQRDRLGRTSHQFLESHVHHCPAGHNSLITRHFPSDLITRAQTPKLSIILPRQAQNFRLEIQDLVISRQ